MAIDPEFLNEKRPHEGTVHTGVYCSHNRNTAIVVKVKDGKVVYMSMITGSIKTETAFLFAFARDFPLVLPNYPATRALRSYRRSGLAIDDVSHKVLRAVLGAA